jgi:hypothetical protein
MSQSRVVPQAPAPIDHRRLLHIGAQHHEMWDADQSESNPCLASFELGFEAVLDIDHRLQVNFRPPFAKPSCNFAGVGSDREVLMTADDPEFHRQARRAQGSVAA